MNIPARSCFALRGPLTSRVIIPLSTASQGSAPPDWVRDLAENPPTPRIELWWGPTRNQHLSYSISCAHLRAHHETFQSGTWGSYSQLTLEVSLAIRKALDTLNRLAEGSWALDATNGTWHYCTSSPIQWTARIKWNPQEKDTRIMLFYHNQEITFDRETQWMASKNLQVPVSYSEAPAILETFRKELEADPEYLGTSSLFGSDWNQYTRAQWDERLLNQSRPDP